jgi:hypothetical protein
MISITAESVNKASRERLRKIESGEVKPDRISTNLKRKQIRDAYIQYCEKTSDQDIMIS